mgnify:CR=1 FL=1|jgi:micrococcal nuclease
MTTANTDYSYTADIIRVVDGDTIDISIDLGFEVARKERVRIAGINAPEIHTKDAAEKAAGMTARQFVVDWVAKHPQVTVTTVKDAEKYGRYLAHVVGTDGQDLGQLLLAANLAKPYDGTGPRASFA